MISAETGRLLALAIAFLMGVVVGWIFFQKDPVDGGDNLVD